jgi:hypothetical protein
MVHIASRAALVLALSSAYWGCTSAAPHATLITVTDTGTATGTGVGPQGGGDPNAFAGGVGPQGTGSGTGTGASPGSGGAGQTAAQALNWDGKSSIGNDQWDVIPASN